GGGGDPRDTAGQRARPERAGQQRHRQLHGELGHGRHGDQLHAAGAGQRRSWTTLQSSSATSRAISGKGNGSYGYHVQACNASGCGPWSGTGSVTVALAPSVPTGLHAVTVNANKGYYTVAWDAVSGATSYDMQQTLPDGTSNIRYSGPNTSASALDLATMGFVTVQVRACSSSACSAWSAGISIMLSSN
ncbi:MAG: hypothetical protein KGJ32_12050, partial [Xanthomonadaceae bacterium]|nr:hypothetical protein [Xanthomonadaceae bacterium]